jgi:ferritin-like metal-binding protein YciE
METRDVLIKWLRDAHAMEKSLITVLEGHAKDSRAYPDISDRIQQHIEETKNHAEVVEDCLQSLGENISGLKETMAKMGGVVQGVTIGGAKDNLVKSAIADFAAEQYEIAAYSALIELANELDEPGIATSLEQNLHEEEDMAAWLEEGLPTVIRTSLRELTPAEPAGSFFEKIETDDLGETEEIDE